MSEMDFGRLNASNESAARQAEDTAVSAAAAGNTLSDKLRSAVSERFQESPLARQRGEALSTYITSAPRARADIAEQVKGGTIFNPSQQSALLSARRASDVVPLLSLNDLLQAQFGGMGDIINAGTNAYKEQVGALQGAAQLARQRSDSALAQLYKQADLDLQNRQLRASQAAKAPSALETMLAQLLSGGGTATAAGGGAQGGGEDSRLANLQVALQNAPTEAARSSIMNTPGIGFVSVNNFTEELPVYAPEGTVATDDVTGASVIFKNGFWAPNTSENQPSTGNWFTNIFGGR